MTRSKSLGRAGQLVLEDEAHESQDSQTILEALKAELGVGRLSGSPVSPRRPHGASHSDRSAGDPAERAEAVEGDAVRAAAAAAAAWQGSARLLTTAASVKQAAPHWASNDDVNGCITPIHRVGHHQAPRPIHPRPRQREPDDAIVIETSPHRDHTRSSQSDAPEFLIANEIPPTVPSGADRSQTNSNKMEPSQQTPTQVNEGRDYGEFCNAIESSPPIVDTLPVHDAHDAHEEERTLQEDDTGAVNFGSLSPAARPSSQMSEDVGFQNTRGEWRVPDQTSQPTGYTPFKPGDMRPETPALPKNPFGPRRTTDVPFAGSQLFGQTPLLTSAARLSPTSSRPSPNLFRQSISPNIMETSPLKHRANVSSPTDIRTSSPQRLHDVPATVFKSRISPIQKETSSLGRRARADMIPESPTIPLLKPSESRQPLAHYEPMKKSQERKTGDEMPAANLAADSDSDDAIVMMKRREKVKKVKARAAQEMEKITIDRSVRREPRESPSRKRRKVMNGAGYDVHQSEATDSEQVKDNKPNPAFRGSQKEPMPSLEAPSAESTKATPGEDAVEAHHSRRNQDTTAQNDANKETADEEMIPATSPVRSLSAGNQRGMVSASEPELPALLEDELPNGGDGGNDAEPSSLPPLRQRTKRTYGRRAVQRRNVVSSSAASDARAIDVSPDPSSAASVAASNVAAPDPARQDGRKASSPPRSRSASIAPKMTRNRGRDRTPLTPLRPRVASRTTHTSSSLSALSTTPAPSSKTTPDTQASPESDRPISISMPPFAAPGKNMRHRAASRHAKGESPQPSARVMKTAARATRVDSESTDELQQSPTSSILGMSVARPRANKVFRHSIGPTYRGRRLFEGMAFAISMQSDQGKQQTRSSLETKIVQAGGLILQEGFQELFEPSAVMSTTGQVTDDDEDALKLAKSSLNCGFTALIADGHSRKVKYMQALALGLPCLAHQWITACLSKGAIVDWEPYLLSAGSSTVLGDAVRSRCLQPYPAADAMLADAIERRPRLLAGKKMLVVVDAKKARGEGKKQQYVFLAQALGSSVYRVSTTQQAREALREHDKAGEPFNWLYIDKSIGTAESVLSAPQATGKKRRRSSAAPVVRNIRVLHDELMIQSLILGRIVEDDEMSF